MTSRALLPGLARALFCDFCDFRVYGSIFSPFGDETFTPEPLLRAHSCLAPAALGVSLSGRAQGAESLMNQAKKRFERIGRAEFDVDTPDASFKASCNLKES